MKRKALVHISLFLSLILSLTHASYAQLIAGPGVADATSSQPAGNRNFSFSGTIPGQLDGALSVTFSIYPDQQSAPALWTETQIVQITAEKYSVMLGSTSATGLPSEIFSADQAHWLGVQVNGAEKRFLLVSVPYAMKAVNADQLGGLPFSEYVTTQQLQSALQGAAGTGSATPPKTSTTGPVGQAAAAGTPPQPATDFTDSNTSEVLLVTQQGTGYAIHAISSGDAALFAENSNTSGTALKVLESASTGLTVGILAQTSSPEGIPAIFDNMSGQGGILRLQSNGNIVTTFSHLGDINTTGQILASRFNGDGSGLVNIPPLAINATPIAISNSVVARDSAANFSGNQITASTFFGSGAGLTDIPPLAINATPITISNSVVARDSAGNFSGNQITASTFFGSGAGLFNIPPFAINATPLTVPNSVVARDSNGNFAANQITASTFSGSGFGLFGIPMSAINATALNLPNSVVARDANGGFVAGNLQVMNQLTSSGFVDFSGAVTAPVRTVLTANIPSLCFSSKELLLVTDAFPGQQLFVCNSNGNGWVLLGDGGGSAGSSNVSGNTTGTLENVSQLGSGTGLTVSSTSGTAVSASSTSGMAIHGDSTSVGVQGSSQGGIGVWAAATANDSTGTALLLSHASQGKLIDGGVSLGAGTDIFETFSVTAEGDVTFNGGMMTPFETTGTWVASSLVKLTSISGNFGAGTVTMTSPGDTSGVIGIISGLPASGSRIQVVQSGQFSCNFDGPATSGHYVGISKTTAGDCADIGATFPTDGQQVVGRVLSSFAPGTGRILLFQSELHSATGGSAVTINTGAGLTGGPITSSGTISVADGGITAAKLAPNAVTSINIADGSLTPAKIAGTAATLGANTFSGSQTIQQNLTVTGTLTNNGGITTSRILSLANPNVMSLTGSGTALTVSGGNVGIAISGSSTAMTATADFGSTVTAQNTNGTALQGSGPVGIDAVTASGVALQARTTAANGTAATFTNAGSGKLISGRSGLSNPIENFSLDTAGNVFAAGALTTQVRNNAAVGTVLNQLARLASDGTAVRAADFVDKTGIIGIVVGGAGFSGNAQIAYGGIANCTFATTTQAGDYVEISGNGSCGDVGAAYPGSGQVIGRVLASNTNTGATLPVLLYGPEQRAPGTITQINTGAGLTGGPIFSNGTISIATGGVTNTLLQNSTINVVPGTGLSGGGVIPLGGAVTLDNTGALSFKGRTGAVLPAAGDYVFNQISGIINPFQLPGDVALTDQNNTFLADVTVNGNFTSRSVSTGALSASGASVVGNTSPAFSLLTVVDSGAAGGNSAVSVISQNNAAEMLTSPGPTIMSAGTTTVRVFSVTPSGVNVSGSATASSFTGDGSGLTNVNASTLDGAAATSFATASALNSETANRQSTEITLQTNINSETTARQSADTTLQNNINAETTARASADASLQSNINSVSSASAQLAAANSFTAKQTLAASTTTSASLNVPAGTAPSTPSAGDVWNTGSTLQYRDNASTTRSLVSTTQSGGLQLLKLTASVTPASVASQACAEQSFTISGISTGDVLLSVLQPSTSSPGTNIAIGGFRVSAANTVAVQFCNVSRNNSTPTAGVYTFAFMR
jgi:hypothetical protein